MALQVVPGTYEDMKTFVVIETEAYKAVNSPLDGLVFKENKEGSDPERQRLEQERIKRNIQSWKDDPTILYFKAVDTATDEVVAFAMYHLYTEDKVDLIKYHKAEDVTTMFGEDVFPGPAGDFFGALWSARERCLGKRPHILLQVLVTDPKHQRRGAGSLLVKKGCEIADELGIVAGLEATAQGRTVYKKFGYVDQEIVELDPKKYGKDAEMVYIASMLRHPTTKTT